MRDVTPRPAPPLRCLLATLALSWRCASSPPPQAADAGRDVVTAPDAMAADVVVTADAAVPDAMAPDAAVPDAMTLDVVMAPDVVAPVDALSSVVSCAPGSRAPLPDTVTQLVRVTTPNWSYAHGVLDRFARNGDGTWSTVGARFGVSIGRSGMGWGRGLHGADAPASCEGPVKREGDGRSPAGVFALGDAYGDHADAGAFSYTLLTPTWRCPDDPRSSHYNEVLDARGLTPDWSSAEEMVRADGLYRWVVFVEHNTAPRLAGSGSCIFLHVWGGATSTTAGCTSMERADLETLLAWMQPGHAALVALPQSVYDAVQPSWGLPPR